MLNCKRPGTCPQSSKLFKKFLKIIALAYIYQSAKFGDVISCGSKKYLKIHLAPCTNTHQNITGFVNHGVFKTTKTWIFWEQNITFLQNKKVLNLCLRWHILRNYCFLVEVIFNNSVNYSINNSSLSSFNYYPITYHDYHSYKIDLLGKIWKKINLPNFMWLSFEIFKVMNNVFPRFMEDIFKLIQIKFPGME